MIYNVLLLILYFILSESVKTPAFWLLVNLSVFVNAYQQQGFSGCLVLVTVGKGGGFLMGRQSHFNVPREHVTGVPLSAVALLNSSRLWITTTLQRDTSKTQLTAQWGATLAHFKNLPIQELSLEACYALNVSRRKVSSDPSDSRPHCCCHVLVLVSLKHKQNKKKDEEKNKQKRKQRQCHNKELKQKMHNINY